MIVDEDLFLLGRSVELSALAARVREAGAGRAGAVLVRGPAGIGKTSLLTALRRDLLAREEFLVLPATCREAARGVGYGAVRALFAPLGLTDPRPDGGPATPLLTGSARWALPALGPDDPDSGPPSDAASYRVLHGLYWLAVNLMADRPLAIVLDDAHWCDERSLRWLQFLLRRADHLPLLVVLGQRTGAGGPTEELLAELFAQPDRVVLNPAPLAPADISELVTQVLRERPDAPFVRSCAEASEGNPLLLKRLLGELARTGVRPDASGVDAVRRIGRDVLAASASDRLDDQPEHVRAVARALAGTLDGAGADVGPQLVGALAGVPPELVGDTLATLRRIDVLAADSLDFVHDVVRAVVFGQIPFDQATRLREKASRLLNEAGRPEEEVANQLLLLPELTEPWMLGVLREAAARSERRGAPEAAIGYHWRVLDAAADTAERARTRVELAGPLTQLDPLAALAQLRLSLDEITDPRARASVATQFGLTSLGAHRAVEGVGVLREALADLAAVLGPDPAAADRELLTFVESALLITGADEKATIDVVRARAHALDPPEGRTPAQRQLVGMMSVLAASETRPATQVVDLARRAVRARAGTGDWAILSAALALTLADEIDAALAAFGWVVDSSREQAAVWTHALALANRALVHYSVGDVREAAADAETAVAVSEQERWEFSSSTPRNALAFTLLAQGKAAQAEAELASVRRPGFDEFVWEWHYFLLASARSRWAQGDPEGALALLRDCERSLAESGTTNPVFAPWWVDMACVLAELGRPREAAAVVERGCDLARQWGTPRATGLGLLARGVIAEGRDAVDLLTEAVDVLSGSPARLTQAHAEVRLGLALLRVDDVRGARERLRSALDLSTRCGVVVLAVVAEQLYVSAGGRRRRTVRSVLDTLTGGERRVAEMAARGRSNREIAEALFVTVRTVEMHLTNTYRKLGVPGRPELVQALRAAVDEGEQE